MNDTCLIVRAANYDDRCSEQVRAMSAYFGRDVYVVLDRYFDDDVCITLENNIISVGGGFLSKTGLPKFEKVGWQCGDFALYAARSALPGYKYYWMIEPDVKINFNKPSEFFDNFSFIYDDFIGANFGLRNERWGCFRSMACLDIGEVYGSCFAILRVSGEALDYLVQKRIEYCSLNRTLNETYSIGKRILFANDEAFVCTYMSSGGWRASSIKELFPDMMTNFSSSVPIHELEIDYLSNKVLHPVCDSRRFNEKLLKLKNRNIKLANIRVQNLEDRLGRSGAAEILESGQIGDDV